MARSGISFTEQEVGIIEGIEKQFPEHFKDDSVYKWFRDYFDEQRKIILSRQKGLDEKVMTGLCNYDNRVSAGLLRADITRMVYAQTKARMFKLLESRFPEGRQLELLKDEAEEIISSVVYNLDRYSEKSLVVGYAITE